MKFNHETGSPEEILIKLQKLAKKAYPTPIDQLVAPVEDTAPDDHENCDRGTSEKENRRNFAHMEKERHVLRLFK